jgi:hypothetical protein
MHITHSARALRTAIAVIALLPPLATAQNLVANPNFDISLDNWTPMFSGSDPLASLTLDAKEGSPSPPSMLFTQLQPATMVDQREILSECIVVTPGQRYDLSYDTRRRPIAIASGMSLRTFSDTSCTNIASQMPTDANSQCVGLSGDWLRCYHHAVLAPVGVAALRLRITGVLMNANNPPLNQFRIDNVRFGPVDTVPVELQSFEIR